MKIARKLFLFFVVFMLTLNGGCSKSNSLYKNVIELRENVYSSEDGEITLKASYGFKIIPINDKNVKKYSLTVRLPNNYLINSETSVSVTFNENTYEDVFSLDSISNAYTAHLYIDNFNLDVFDATIKTGSDCTVYKMQSMVNKNALDYKSALNSLNSSKPDLIKIYTDTNGRFSADIIMRIIAKNDKNYWYIGFMKGDNLKALLLDATDGKVLAIREIK